jgi:hypothetical protein
VSQKLDNIENSLKLLKKELVNNIKEYEQKLRLIRPLKAVAERVEKAGIDIMTFHTTDDDGTVTKEAISLVIPIEIQDFKFANRREMDMFKILCQDIIIQASPDTEELKRRLDEKVEEMENNAAKLLEAEKETLATSLQSIITRNILDEA